jgi:hypothetical protein
VFEPLRADYGFFAAVRIDEELGTVVQRNGADLSPEVLYARSAAGAAGLKRTWRGCARRPSRWSGHAVGQEEQLGPPEQPCADLNRRSCPPRRAVPAERERSDLAAFPVPPAPMLVSRCGSCRAGLRESVGELSAESSSGAGDEGDLAGEIEQFGQGHRFSWGRGELR